MYPLTLFAIGGMLLFPAANDLLTMFVALEVLSLPLYLLCGLARRRRLLSQEAAMKYFLLGAFSSAFFLFGIAMLYGFAGSVRLSAIAAAASSNTSSLTLLYAGIALVGLGLFFKIGAVPFQSWKPDVYQGAPTPVTALMASCTLVSAFGALLRVFYVAFGQLSWSWRPAMIGIAILTMLGGSIVAITQTDVKRLLAYSSIAQAGYVLTGVVAASTAGLSSSLFYLAAYGMAVIGAFAVVTLVRDQAGEAAHLSRWAGLGKRSPLVAGIFAFFLITFAGIPLTSGFTGKFAVFQAAVRGGVLSAGHHRRAEQRDPGVSLRQGDRADVLQRAGAGRPGGGPAQRLHRGDPGRRGRGDAGARHRAGAAAQPRQPRRDPAFCPLSYLLPGHAPPASPFPAHGPACRWCSRIALGAYLGLPCLAHIVGVLLCLPADGRFAAGAGAPPSRESD